MIHFPRERRSLFGEILDLMLAPLLLLWPMSVALTWAVAQGIANRPYDRELEAMTRLLARQAAEVERAPNAVAAQRTIDGLGIDVARHDDIDIVYIQVLGRRGELLTGDRDLPVPDEPPRPGEMLFRNDRLHDAEVRVGYMWLPSGSEPARSLVQVAETLDKRSQLADEIIKGVIFPQFLILPTAVLLVWLALSRGLLPLHDLQQRIRQRQSQDLSPIDEHDVPEEVTPLVSAINDLLARLDNSIARQKHFLADAAHQLKTPLAGLRTQAELAQRELDRGDAASARGSLRQIARSSQRAADMVNQLLSMARAEDKEQRTREQDVDLLRLASDVVRDFYPRASDKRIDLGLEGAEPEALLVPVWVRGHVLLLRELLRNLVDNAIIYTPQGGRVTVRVLPDPFGQVAVLQVEDDGPGIPEAERERVFQPFYRPSDNVIEGSGLGLAIVQEIAQIHGASVTLEDAQVRTPQRPMPGARFTLRFAAKAGPRSSDGPTRDRDMSLSDPR
jgi:two-component system sensor histidine kinase TctE